MPRTRKQSSVPSVSCEQIDALMAALRKADLPPPPKGARTLRELCDSFDPPKAERTMGRLLAKVGAKKTICRGANGCATAYYVLESGK